jgi:hypothetical protein
MTFDEWYESQGEWWKDKRAELYEAWDSLCGNLGECYGKGPTKDEYAARIFSTIAAAIRAQYGD